MSMQGQPMPDTQAPIKGAPRVAIQYEHPTELLQFVTDQIDSLDQEINEWEARLFRLRTCRDALSQAGGYLNEVLAQTNPSMSPGYSR